MATNTGSPYFIPFPEDNDPVDVAGDFEALARHLNDNFEEYVSDTVAVLVTGNTENGINVTVDDNTNKINFDVDDPVITFTGDVSGSGQIINLSNTEFELTINPNSVELGTDTTGPYIATIEGTENQVNVLGSSTESSDIVLSLPQDIDEGANPTFAGATLGDIQVGITEDNHLDTAEGDLIISSEGGTTTLKDDVVIEGDFDVDHVDLVNDRETPPDYVEGRVFYDNKTKSISFYDNNNTDAWGLGRILYLVVLNDSGTTISRGKLITCSGFDEVTGYPNVVLADKEGTEPAVGITMESIPDGGTGKMMIFGRLDDLDTSTVAEGDVLYLGTSGNFTNVRPVAEELFQVVGKAGIINSTSGCILVNVDPTSDLVPNLPAGHIWYGDENFQAIATRDPQLNSLVLDDDLEVNGGNITTAASEFTIVDANALTVYIGREATAVGIGDDTGLTTIYHDFQVDGNTDIKGDLKVDGNTVIDGSLTVNGTTTTINSITYTVEDPLLVIGSAPPLPSGEELIADDKDRGIEFRWFENTPGGVESRTGFFGFDNSTQRFTFIPDGTNTNEIFAGSLGDVEINNLYVSSIIPAGGTLNISQDLDVDGDVNIDGGDLTTTATTFNLLNNTATTINLGGAATAITLGATTGTTTIKNNLQVDLDLNVDGGDITTTATTFNLLKTNVTSLDFALAATDIEIGATTGTTNIRNSLDVDGDVNIDGGDLTASTSTFNLLNSTVTTLNIANAATAITLGATTGNTTVRNNLITSGTLTINGTTTTFSPPTTSPPFTLGANAIGQLVTGLNADLLDGQSGEWYQARANHTGTQLHTTVSDWTEAVEDTVGPMFAHQLHSNLIAEYNDVTGQIILTAPSLPSGFGDSIGVTAAQMYWFGV